MPKSCKANPNHKSHKGKSNEIPKAEIPNQIPNIVLFSTQNSSNVKADIE